MAWRKYMALSRHRLTYLTRPCEATDEDERVRLHALNDFRIDGIASETVRISQSLGRIRVW